MQHHHKGQRGVTTRRDSARSPPQWTARGHHPKEQHGVTAIREKKRNEERNGAPHRKWDEVTIAAVPAPPLPICRKALWECAKRAIDVAIALLRRLAFTRGDRRRSAQPEEELLNGTSREQATSCYSPVQVHRPGCAIYLRMAPPPPFSLPFPWLRHR